MSSPFWARALSRGEKEKRSHITSFLLYSYLTVTLTTATYLIATYFKVTTATKPPATFAQEYTVALPSSYLSSSHAHGMAIKACALLQIYIVDTRRCDVLSHKVLRHYERAFALPTSTNTCAKRWAKEEKEKTIAHHQLLTLQFFNSHTYYSYVLYGDYNY